MVGGGVGEVSVCRIYVSCTVDERGGGRGGSCESESECKSEGGYEGEGKRVCRNLGHVECRWIGWWLQGRPGGKRK